MKKEFPIEMNTIERHFRCVFLFSMGYLVFIHWYRWYILTTYSIDVTGPMMVGPIFLI